jgi:hypothetical protein
MEILTFHCGVKKKLEDVTKNNKPKIKLPIKNHPPKLWWIKIVRRTNIVMSGSLNF